MAGSAAAQDPDLSALQWRNIGPNRGGRSQAIAGSVSRPLEYYFGATGGGLWKTTDGGTTWAPVTDGQIRSSSVGAVAVAESNPAVIYLGMGETEFRANVMQGDGVYKSTDSGKTWRNIGLADTQAIARIRVDPANPDLVYVAAFGHPYGPNSARGIFRSTDGGGTWQRILFRDDHTGAGDLAMDPHHPRILFASLWDAYRTPWSLCSGGPSSGLFKSTDGGDTWTELSRAPGMPKGVLGKITVAVSPADSNRVYAMVEAADGGLFQSNDAGATWRLVNADRSIRQRAFYFSRIAADPRYRDTLYVMNVELYRTDDGGQTLNLMHTPHGDHHDLWIAPNDPLRLGASDDGGGSVSVDGGKTWTLQNYPTGQFYHVATTAEFPYDVCGAQQDDGSAAVPSNPGTYRRDPRGAPGDWLYPVGGGEAGYVAPDPLNPNIFYSGDQAGMITRFDRRTGNSRSVAVYPFFFSGSAAGTLKDRWQWTFPIVFSPAEPTALYTSSQHLFKSTSGGQHWEMISPDLTRHDPTTLGDSGGPITKDQNGPEFYATIFSIAPSRHDAKTIWTGSDDGLVYLTRDGGKHWANVTPPGLGEFNRVSMIEASPHDPAAAFVAAKRYQLDDRAPYVFKTHDYGKTWTRITEGIRPGDFAQSIREDPRRAGLLYLGTEHGIYVSWDDGGHWRSLSLNLPDTQVSDLVVERNDLVISTHGRAFWILEDLVPLRQFTADVPTQPAQLFKPEPVVRSVTTAAIDYYLPGSTGPVTLEILDPQGQVIRTFTGGKTKDLTSRPGSNRYVWDLRYPGAATFPGLVLRGAVPGQGPTAPPGTYTVRLTANGATASQALVVTRNPRLADVTDADLQEQFRLAIQIRDATDRAHRAILQIRDERAAVNRRAQAAGRAEISALAQSISAKLTTIEEDLYQTKLRSPRDVFNYPIKLNNQLAVLQSVVDLGENRPTDQDYGVYRELKSDLDPILAQLDLVMKNDVTHFDEELAKKPVTPTADKL